MNGEGSPAFARLIQLAFVALVVGCWWLVGQTGAVSALLLPPIGAVWNAFVALVQTRAFWSSVLLTLETVVEAFAIAGALGFAIGYAATRSRVLADVVEPVLSSLFAIPITLFFPLFILFFGIGPASKVAYAASYGVFPVALNTIAALSSVDERHLTAARSMGMPALGVLRHILFPSSFPTILTGLRIAFFVCFASVLGGETISSLAGVGHNIAMQAELMDSAQMYAWIVFVILTSLVMNAIISMIEQRPASHW